jgi:hypothetical protein
VVDQSMMRLLPNRSLRSSEAGSLKAQFEAQPAVVTGHAQRQVAAGPELEEGLPPRPAPHLKLEVAGRQDQPAGFPVHEIADVLPLHGQVGLLQDFDFGQFGQPGLRQCRRVHEQHPGQQGRPAGPEK